MSKWQAILSYSFGLPTNHSCYKNGQHFLQRIPYAPLPPDVFYPFQQTRFLHWYTASYFLFLCSIPYRPLFEITLFILALLIRSPWIFKTYILTVLSTHDKLKYNNMQCRIMTKYTKTRRYIWPIQNIRSLGCPLRVRLVSWRPCICGWLQE